MVALSSQFDKAAQAEWQEQEELKLQAMRDTMTPQISYQMAAATEELMSNKGPAKPRVMVNH